MSLLYEAACEPAAFASRLLILRASFCRLTSSSAALTADRKNGVREQPPVRCIFTKDANRPSDSSVTPRLLCTLCLRRVWKRLMENAYANVAALTSRSIVAKITSGTKGDLFSSTFVKAAHML